MLRNRLVLATAMWREATANRFPRMPPGEPGRAARGVRAAAGGPALQPRPRPQTARDVADKTWDLVHDRPDDDPRQAARGGVPRGAGPPVGARAEIPRPSMSQGPWGAARAVRPRGSRPARSPTCSRPGPSSAALTLVLPHERRSDDTAVRCSPGDRAVRSAPWSSSRSGARPRVAPARGRGGGHGDPRRSPTTRRRAVAAVPAALLLDGPLRLLLLPDAARRWCTSRFIGVCYAVVLVDRTARCRAMAARGGHPGWWPGS